MAALRPPVPVSVVEEHDEALVCIYRAIGSKRLPLSGTALIHFDAHPDLLSPNLPADEFCEKEKLFAHMSIAEWILPAVYMGHIGSVVWLKPPWSSQMSDGEYCLVVGREEGSGHLRVGTPLAYFISDQLYAPTDTLTNTRAIALHVVTLPVLEQPWSQLGEHLAGQQLVGQQLAGQQVAGQQLAGGKLTGQQLEGQQLAGQLAGQLADNVSSQKRDEVCEAAIFLERSVTHDRSTGEVADTTEQGVNWEERGDWNSSHVVERVKEMDGLASAKTVGSVNAILSVSEREESCRVEENSITSEWRGKCVPVLEREEVRAPLSKRSRLEPASPHPHPSHPHTPPPSHSSLMTRAMGVVGGVLRKCQSWVLDIDLDFFSTANPFRDEFSHEEYSFLERLYKFQEPSSSSQQSVAESVAESVAGRERQLESLLDLWRGEVEPPESHQLTSEDREWVSALKEKIMTLSVGSPEDVHLAGMMTDLPHHPASEAEMRGLLAATSLVLHTATSSPSSLPGLVTIARSTEDGYTPAAHVEQLQAAAVGVAKDLCDGHIHLQHHYLDSVNRSHDETQIVT